MNTMELIRSRRSVRSFDGRAIPEREKEDLLRFVSSAETPYELPIEWRLLDARAQGLSCPVITGTDIYLAGKMLPAPHAEEAFGFAFERAALYALSKGIGTTCIAGTMDRPAFERAMELSGGEVMPCITPLGYPAAKMSLRESMMRKGVRADSRLSFAELFFDGGFSAPLTEEKAGELADALAVLQEDDRSIVLLSYFAGWTDKRIASFLGRPRSTVQYRRFKALRQLRMLLRGEEVDDVDV